MCPFLLACLLPPGTMVETALEETADIHVIQIPLLYTLQTRRCQMQQAIHSPSDIETYLHRVYGSLDTEQNILEIYVER